MHPHINIAIRAATEAGKVVVRHINKIESLSIHNKGRKDFVSDVNYLVEQAILDILTEAYPDHNILAKKSGSHGDRDKSEYQWVIDPLSGASNYLHGYPTYAVSIALLKRGMVRHSVVYDPLKDELFHASIGEGAFLNQRRMRLSGCKNMQSALIGTRFPFKKIEEMDKYFEIFRRIVPRCEGMRCTGSVALDLAYLAAGRLDGVWEIELKPWNIAAGALLIQESTGVITDSKGNNSYFKSGHVIAGGLDIHKELLTLVNLR